MVKPNTLKVFLGIFSFLLKILLLITVFSFVLKNNFYFYRHNLYLLINEPIELPYEIVNLHEGNTYGLIFDKTSVEGHTIITAYDTVDYTVLYEVETIDIDGRKDKVDINVNIYEKSSLYRKAQREIIPDIITFTNLPDNVYRICLPLCGVCIIVIIVIFSQLSQKGRSR